MTNAISLTIRKYSWRYAGNVAFWIQRYTGLALVAYLILHVHTIHDLRDPKTFSTALETFSTPLFKIATTESLVRGKTCTALRAAKS